MRQVVIISNTDRGLLPAGPLFVNGFAFGKPVDNDRLTPDRLAINRVTRTDLNGLELIENIQLCYTQSGNAAVDDGSAQCDRIKPSATAWPARGCAELGANFRQVGTVVIKKLCRKRPCTNTSGIGLHDTENVIEIARTDTRSNACGGRNRI